jgi:hypothetical protein
MMIDVRQRLELQSGVSLTFHSLPLLEDRGVGRIARLPVSLRVLLESSEQLIVQEATHDSDQAELRR